MSDKEKSVRGAIFKEKLFMTAQRQREIVIEFEKVQTIRKRAKTTLAVCHGCGAETDAVSLIEAGELFETTNDDLFQFIKQNGCHYHVGDGNRIYLCVTSLLKCMQQKNQTRRIGAKGE